MFYIVLVLREKPRFLIYVSGRGVQNGLMASELSYHHNGLVSVNSFGRNGWFQPVQPLRSTQPWLLDRDNFQNFSEHTWEEIH